MAKTGMVIQHKYPRQLQQIKMALTSLRDSSLQLDLATIHGVMIGILTESAPTIFNITVCQRVHDNYIWDHFQCCESFVKKLLKEEMQWSLHCATRPGEKTLKNVTTDPHQCSQARKPQKISYRFLPTLPFTLSGPYPNTMSQNLSQLTLIRQESYTQQVVLQPGL
jgi:hypothetical protein